MSSAEQAQNGAKHRQSWFWRWLDRRIPPSRSIRLSQSSIFIFPTATGFAYSGLILLLLLGAINYQNNLVFALAFLLGSLFVVTILYTYSNLSGLQVELAGSDPCFVGEEAAFSIRVTRPAVRPREGIQVGWPGTVPRWAELEQHDSAVVRLFYPARRRGWLDPGRLLVETYYPLGLLRAWTWVDLQAAALVYPRPLLDDAGQPGSGHREDGELVDPRGSDDFTALREYRPGDQIRHIFWPAYARSDELLVKEYASYQDPQLMLDFSVLTGPVEERLSRLCGQALRAHRRGQSFGLRLPPVTLAPAVGQGHLERVLRELALYGH